MKNKSFPIIFALILSLSMVGQIKPAHAQWTVFDPPGDANLIAINIHDGIWQTIQNLWQDAQQILQDINWEINTFQQNLNKMIAGQVADHAKPGIQSQANTQLGSDALAAWRRQQEISQEAIEIAAGRTQEALMEAIRRNQPRPGDCEKITHNMIVNYNNKINFGSMSNITSQITQDITNGVSPISVQNTFQKNLTNARNNSTSTDPNVIKYNTDLNAPLKYCPNDTCFNTWVSQRLLDTAVASLGAKPPGGNISNAEYSKYLKAWGKWNTDYSKALETATRLTVALDYRSLNNYTMAAGMITSSDTPASPDDYLSTYAGGRAKVIGLTKPELQKIEYEIGVSSAKSDTIDKDRAQLEQAMAVLETPEPQPPAGSIPVNGAAAAK
jgi:hypothetical protein